MVDTPPPMPVAVELPGPAAILPPGDFHDRLSPMLVKELRQGLRAKTFISVFLALQGFLAFVLLTAAAGINHSSGGNTISGIIFFFFSITALVIQPLRGIGSLNSEIKGNTIELMVLTRLSAWRIVLGKWVSIVSQTGLLLVAIIPYMILRYFFGGMQLFAELLMLFTVFFFSAALTAVTVGLSGLSSIFVRGLLPLIGGMVLLITIWNVAFSMGFSRIASSFSLQSSEARWMLFVVYFTGAYIAWLALGLGTSIIAPASENHSTSRRLVALAAMLMVTFAARSQFIREEQIIMLLVLATGPILILSLTEPFHLLPPVCQRFVKLGAPGRIAGRFLYPGWPSGTLFSGLMIVLAILSFKLSRGSYSSDTAIFLISCAGTLLFPTAIIGLFQNRMKNRLSVYLIFLVGCVIVSIIVAIISSSTNLKNLLWAFVWLPPVTPLIREIQGVRGETATFVASLVTIVYGTISLIFALVRMRGISEIEKQVQLQPTTEPQ